MSLTEALFGKKSADGSVFAPRQVGSKGVARYFNKAEDPPPAPEPAPPPPTRRERQRPGKRLRHGVDPHDEEDRRTVFVGNLPNTVAKRTVEKLFHDCGTVESVRVRCQQLSPLEAEKRDRGRAIRVLRGEVQKESYNSAVAYVLFTEESAVSLALSKNGALVDGRHVVVTREDASSKLYSPQRSIFLGNLAPTTTEEEVRSFFESRGVGTLQRVRLIRDRSTAMVKGVGYVEFADAKSVNPAIACRGETLHERPVRICHTAQSPKANAQRPSRRERRAAPAATPARARPTEEAAEAPWMGRQTNPRRKLDRDLRTLIPAPPKRGAKKKAAPPPKKKVAPQKKKEA